MTFWQGGEAYKVLLCASFLNWLGKLYKRQLTKCITWSMIIRKNMETLNYNDKIFISSSNTENGEVDKEMYCLR
jgi:hypothetical protein